MSKKIAHLLVLVSSLAYGQAPTGTLVGRALDKETKEPLVEVNIFLRGTFLGGVSDASGNFQIRNIPKGLYTVTVTLVGYLSQSLVGVEITEGIEKRLDVELESTLIQKEQVVVTASRYEQSVRDVPVSIATVTARELADRVSVNLDDALRYVPGVHMMQDQVNIRGSTGYSRGVGSRVLVLFDGLPYTTGDTGEITWETLPMYQVDRIEIVKGAGSALYGSNALGGVINVITRDVPSDPEIRWRVYSGLYDKPRYSEWTWSSKPRFNSGGHIGFSTSAGSFSFLGSISRSVDESYRENDVYHRWSAFTKMKYFLSPTQNLTLMANVMSRSHGNFFWWKSLSEATRPAPSQKNGNVDSKRGSVSFAYKEFTSEDFFYTVRGIYYGNFWRDDSSGRVNNVSASHMLHAEIQGTYQTSMRNMLTLGITGTYDQVQSNIFGNHPGIGGALYVQDEIKVTEDLKWSFGVRYDWQKVLALPAAFQLSPKMGLVYAPTRETTFRASFAQGFRYPSISELYTSASTGITSLLIVPNPDSLQTERSKSFEFGATLALGNSVFFDAAFFQNDFDQLMEPRVKAVRPDSIIIQFENITKARIRGAEFGLRSELFDKYVSVGLAYTYTDPQDLSDPSRVAILKFRPRHLFSTSLQFNYEHIRTSIDFRYSSRVEKIDELLVQFAPIINGSQRVPIKVLDARFSYDFRGVEIPVRAGLNVNNVFNYHYVELIGNLAPVRSYTVVIEGLF